MSTAIMVFMNLSSVPGISSTWSGNDLPYIGNETFMMTYGDGVCDVDIRKLLRHHRGHGKLATLTAVIQKQRKGILNNGRTMWSPRSGKRLRTTGSRSMPDIWSWSRRSWIILRGTVQALNGNRWRGFQIECMFRS